MPPTATTTQKLALEILGLGPEEHLPLWGISGGGGASVQQWWDREQAAVA